MYNSMTEEYIENVFPPLLARKVVYLFKLMNYRPGDGAEHNDEEKFLDEEKINFTFNVSSFPVVPLPHHPPNRSIIQETIYYFIFSLHSNFEAFAGFHRKKKTFTVPE